MTVAAETGGARGPALLLRLEQFEGPLDLLLHLIRSQQLDIRNIPIALVTEQYLACLEVMQELDIDLAADWLVMAATLLHIKSKMLLPAPAEPEAAEEPDPRDELARRLLEYERYKEAGLALGARDVLGREVFARTFEPPDLTDPAFRAAGPRPFEPVSVSELLVAFARAIASRPKQSVHEVAIERVSLADKIAELLDRLAARDSLGFDELFPETATRSDVVVSFLAVLELVKMRVVRAYQAGPFGPIRLFRSESAAGPAEPPPDDLPASPPPDEADRRGAPGAVSSAEPGFVPEGTEE